MARFLQQSEGSFPALLKSSPAIASLSKSSRREIAITLSLFGIVLMMRLLALGRLAQCELLLPAGGDMRFYHDWALRILHGVWTDHLAFYGLPLYPYLLAGIYRLFGVNPFVPGFLQALLEAGTAVLLYRMARTIFAQQDTSAEPCRVLKRSEAIGVLAATGWAFCLPAQAYSIILMPTSAFVFVFWFLVWQVLRRETTPAGWILLCFGLLVGLTAMAVATILFVLPLLLAAIFLKWSATRSRGVTATGLLMAGVLLGASPAWIHNCLIARDPVFLSAHGGINFWIGNNPVATGYPKFPPGLHAEQQEMLNDSIAAAERASGHALPRSEVSAFWSSKASEWILEHPFAWLQLLGTKVKNFWNAFQYDDLSIISQLRDRAIIFPGIGFGMIAALALPGIMIGCWRNKNIRWLAAAPLLVMTSLLAVFITERYRLVAVPALLLFAGLTISEIWRRLIAAEYANCVMVLLLVAASTAFVSLPQHDETLWSLDAYNSGIKALEAGRLSEAEGKLNRAYAYSPYNAGINFAEGNLRFAQGERHAASSFYQATLRLDPQHPGAWNNLGVLALQEQHWQAAAHCFTRALELNASAKTFYLLAQAQFHAGNLLAADTAIVHAMQLSPERPEFRFLADRITTASNMPPLP